MLVKPCLSCHGQPSGVKGVWNTVFTACFLKDTWNETCCVIEFSHADLLVKFPYSLVSRLSSAPCPAGHWGEPENKAVFPHFPTIKLGNMV